MIVDIRSKTLETIRKQGPISFSFLVESLVLHTNNFHTPVILSILQLEDEGKIVRLLGLKNSFYMVREGLS